MPNKAIIITIGDELLIGQTIDTNSTHIALSLGAHNIEVIRKIAISDNKEDIRETLDEALKKADIIIFTGGLGPTADDITKPVLCEYFGGSLVRNHEVLAHIEAIFSKRNIPMLERNAMQADVPDVCTVLFNQMGTAPGMLFEKDGKYIASLPGVPFEMKYILENELIPFLKDKVHSDEVVLHKHIVTSGIPESMLAERIREIEEAFPAHIHLAYLPSLRMVKLRITAVGADIAMLETETQTIVEAITASVQEYIIGYEDLGLDSYASRLLEEKKLMLGTAESCTGGYFGHLITNIPGSSRYYKGGIIAYANEVKEHILNVPSAILATEGAVSEATVLAMAQGAVEQLQTDLAISVSGILGPDGGTPQKPVGLVWMAIANKEGRIATRKLQLRYTRLTNKEAVINEGWAFLREFILENY